jgi:hypothetical protein
MNYIKKESDKHKKIRIEKEENTERKRTKI